MASVFTECKEQLGFGRTMAGLAPLDVESVIAGLAADPDAQVLAGGTDFMVEVNCGHRRPRSVISLRRVAEMQQWSVEGEVVRIGAGVPYSRIERGAIAELAPCLAQAARTVGSPQIRNAGTIGGNLATASPAGDTLPPLAALEATVEVAGPDGRRRLRIDELVVGPKRTSLDGGELIVSVDVPIVAGHQEYLKVGTRNAMVISIAGVALVMDVAGRSIRCALGSVGPVPIRATGAEAFVTGRIDWDAGRLSDDDAAAFGVMVAEASRPIDDHRSSAEYRRHAIDVCARRAIRRAVDAFPAGSGGP